MPTAWFHASSKAWWAVTGGRCGLIPKSNAVRTSRTSQNFQGIARLILRNTCSQMIISKQLPFDQTRLAPQQNLYSCANASSISILPSGSKAASCASLL